MRGRRAGGPRLRLGPSSHTPLTGDQRFIEALREALGLGPLYGDPMSRGRGVTEEEREAARFYIGHAPYSDGRTPPRGSFS